MTSTTIFILIFAIIGTFFVVVSLHLAKKRKEAIKDWAAKNGYDFVDKSSELSLLEPFRIAQFGRRQHIYNLAHREDSNGRLAYGDLHYTTGSGKHKKRVSRSFVIIRPKNQIGVSFFITPESWFDKLIEMFGYQDIDLQNYPEFSKKYLLRGSDPIKIQQSLNSDFVTLLLASKPLHLEANAGNLLVSTIRGCVAPEEVQNFIEQANRILRALS